MVDTLERMKKKELQTFEGNHESKPKSLTLVATNALADHHVGNICFLRQATAVLTVDIASSLPDHPKYLGQPRSTPRPDYEYPTSNEWKHSCQTTSHKYYQIRQLPSHSQILESYSLGLQ